MMTLAMCTCAFGLKNKPQTTNKQTKNFEIGDQKQPWVKVAQKCSAFFVGQDFLQRKMGNGKKQEASYVFSVTKCNTRQKIVCDKFISLWN